MLPACSLWRGCAEDTPWSLEWAWCRRPSQSPSTQGPCTALIHPLQDQDPPAAVHAAPEACSSCFCKRPPGLSLQFMKTHQAVPAWSQGTCLPEGLTFLGEITDPHGRMSGVRVGQAALRTAGPGQGHRLRTAGEGV